VKSKTIRSAGKAAAKKATPATQRKPARRHAVAEGEVVAEAASPAETVVEVEHQVEHQAAAAVAASVAESLAPAAAENAQAARLSHETMDALVRSSTALARGLQEVQQLWLGFAQASLQDGAAVARALAAARSPREVLQLQSDYARATFDKLMAESGRASQLSLRAANEAARPLQQQVGTAMSRLWRRQAA
jgi:phasin family protein